MTLRTKLRVELSNRPGALAAVAAEIGAAGGNVLAVDVHEVDGARVVDEIAVDLPDDADLDLLGHRLTQSGTATLLNHSPGARQVDPVLRTVRWASAMLGAGPHGADDELARAMAEVCGSPATWVTAVADARRLETGRLALSRGQPVAHRTSDVPARLVPAPGDVWLLAVPDARLDPRRVAFVARPLQARFTATEVARVEALVGLRRYVETLAPTVEGEVLSLLA